MTNAYVDTDGTLVVVNASTTDARYFICVARNAYGIDQAQLNFVVQGWYIDQAQLNLVVKGRYIDQAQLNLVVKGRYIDQAQQNLVVKVRYIDNLCRP